MNASSHSDRVPERIADAAAHPGDCIESVHRHITSAITSLTEGGASSLPEVQSQLEEAILMLNLLKAGLPRSRSEKESLVSLVEQVQASNHLLGEILTQGSTICRLRLAKLGTSLGGYTADGHPAQIDPPQKVAVVG